jgi:hypothetical protein
VPLWSLHVLNVLLLVLHTGLIGFNLVGWAWRRTRRWHLATLGATAASWFLLAPWYGVGHCLCTDWHWRIRRELGIVDPERGYIQFLVRVLTGLQPDHNLVRNVTGGIFLAIVVLSVALTRRDVRRSRFAAEGQEPHFGRTGRA